MSAREMKSVPVTILTGFLGSGKTTLLNHIIKSRPDTHFAIIENEFGEVPIDNELVIKAEEDLFTLQNGCICCSLQSDILDILVKLASKKYRVDHIIIESTGVADPAPLAQLFINNMELQNYYSLDGVICLVDAKNFDFQLSEHPETTKQLAMADLILLNKIDKVGSADISRISKKVRAINQITDIELTAHAEINISKLLSLRAYDLQEIEKSIAPMFLFTPIGNVPLSPLKTTYYKHASVHNIQTFSLKFMGDINFLKFNAWLTGFVMLQGLNLYRAKGIVSSSTSDHKVIFQSVHYEIDGMEGDSWGGQPRENKMVFIGKELPEAEIRKQVLDCLV